MSPQWIINELSKHLISEMRNYRKATYGNRKLTPEEERELFGFYEDWSYQYVYDHSLLRAARKQIFLAFNGEMNAFLGD